MTPDHNRDRLVSPWVSTRKERTGYDVRESRKGYLLGWVSFDPSCPEPWSAYCRTGTCGRIPGDSKAGAATELHEHFLSAHR